MLNGLDLFSGIGGLTVALAPWAIPVAYCENDRYAQSILLSRMGDGTLPIAPIWDDVRTLSAEFVGAEIDIVYGGFPCQDLSQAGAQAGLDGDRSKLFFELVRLVSEVRPEFVFLENVPAITLLGLDRVLGELIALGFDCRWSIISAGEMGAPHLRERWWLLAHSMRAGLQESGGLEDAEGEYRTTPRDDHQATVAHDRCSLGASQAWLSGRGLA